MTSRSANPHLSRQLHLVAALIALLLVLPSQSEAQAKIAPSPVAQAAIDPAWNRTLAIFLKAAEGDDDAVEPALNALTPMVAARPADPMLMSYHGATVMMQARASWLPWRKISRTEDGLAMIDKALTLLTPAHNSTLHAGIPTALETRFVAASAFLGLPDLFHRKDRGRTLLTNVLSSPQLSTTPLSFRGAVWLRAAKLAGEDKQIAQERRWLIQIIDAQAPQAPLAQQRLQEIKP